MIVHDHEQNSPGWYASRLGIPTASEFSRIATADKGLLSKSAGPYIHELIAQRLAPGEFVESFKSDAMDRGHEMEPRAIASYAFIKGVSPKTVGLCTSDCKRYGASPDALVDDDGCLEIKSPMAKHHLTYYTSGVLPLTYRQQVHGVLAVTGRSWCDFVSFHPELPLFVCRVERDKYTEDLKASVEKFCDDLDKQFTDIKAALTAEGYQTAEVA